MIKKTILFLLVFIPAITNMAQKDTLQQIAVFLDQYSEIAAHDSSQIWDRSLDVPVIVSFPESDQIIINRHEKGFDETQFKGIYIGKSDSILSGGNSSKYWRGRSWAFLTYPLPNNPRAQYDLLFHESFHSIQADIGLDGKWTQCKHLTNQDARVLLKLEIAALIKALQHNDSVLHLINALSFRKERYMKYPEAKKEEQPIEIKEGLAMYTGMKLAGYTKAEVIDYMGNNGEYNPQTFAYTTGLLYGYILDMADDDWRALITQSNNFLDFTKKIYGTALPRNTVNYNKQSRKKYNNGSIIANEQLRSKKNKKQKDQYLQMFWENPVLIIDTKTCDEIVFNSNIIYPIKEGKVYNRVRLQGNWGNLNAKREIFVGKTILVPIEYNIDSLLTGEQWNLTLNKNWDIKKTGHKNFILEKEKANTQQ